MTPEMFNSFIGIANALSPENLHCDGEVSRAQARRREHQLKARWKELEKQLGRPVSEDEIWTKWIEQRRAR